MGTVAPKEEEWKRKLSNSERVFCNSWERHLWLAGCDSSSSNHHHLSQHIESIVMSPPSTTTTHSANRTHFRRKQCRDSVNVFLVESALAFSSRDGGVHSICLYLLSSRPPLPSSITHNSGSEAENKTS